MRKIIGLIITLSFTGNILSASIENEFNAYIQHLNNLREVNSTDAIDFLLWENFTVKETKISLSGRMSNGNVDRESFIQNLNNYLKYKEISIRLSSSDLKILHEDSTKGELTVIQQLDILYDDKLIESRSIQSHFHYKRLNGNWKIVHAHHISRVYLRNAGKCPCTIYKNRNSFIAETYIPSGFQYDRSFNKFRFSDNKERTIITYSKNFYYQTKAGELSNDKGTILGKATGRNEAMKLILLTINSNRCLSFD